MQLLFRPLSPSPEAGEVQKGKEGEVESEVVDYTKIPTQLERKFEEFDESNDF